MISAPSKPSSLSISKFSSYDCSASFSEAAAAAEGAGGGATDAGAGALACWGPGLGARWGACCVVLAGLLRAPAQVGQDRIIGVEAMNCKVKEQEVKNRLVNSNPGQHWGLPASSCKRWPPPNMVGDVCARVPRHALKGCERMDVHTQPKVCAGQARDCKACNHSAWIYKARSRHARVDHKARDCKAWNYKAWVAKAWSRHAGLDS
eukprot:1141105-Pelagomonas_calceolata.AAC.2